jgi:hypothetical protein
MQESSGISTTTFAGIVDELLKWQLRKCKGKKLGATCKNTEVQDQQLQDR